MGAACQNKSPKSWLSTSKYVKKMAMGAVVFVIILKGKVLLRIVVEMDAKWVRNWLDCTGMQSSPNGREAISILLSLSENFEGADPRDPS